MKRLITICSVLCLVLIGFTQTKADTTMTFEEFLGFDAAPISTFYSGITFEAASSGQDWIASDVTTGNYNASSWPSGTSWGSGEYWMYDYVCAWTGVAGDNGKISFGNEDATYVELGYSAYYTLNLTAYDSADNVIDADSGQPNLRYINGNPNGPGTLHVDWDGVNHIAYVTIGDQGNYWVVDNIITDASGIVIIPAPGAILLGGLGVSLVGWLKRRRTL